MTKPNNVRKILCSLLAFIFLTYGLPIQNVSAQGGTLSVEEQMNPYAPSVSLTENPTEKQDEIEHKSSLDPSNESPLDRTDNRAFDIKSTVEPYKNGYGVEAADFIGQGPFFVYLNPQKINSILPEFLETAKKLDVEIAITAYKDKNGFLKIAAYSSNDRQSIRLHEKAEAFLTQNGHEILASVSTNPNKTSELLPSRVDRVSAMLGVINFQTRGLSTVILFNEKGESEKAAIENIFQTFEDLKSSLPTSGPDADNNEDASTILYTQLMGLQRSLKENEGVEVFADIPTIDGQAITQPNPSEVRGTPSSFVTGKYISTRVAGAGIESYVYDVRRADADGAIYRLNATDGVMSIDNNFTLWMKIAEDLGGEVIAGEPKTLNLPLVLRFKAVDSKGKEVLADLRFTSADTKRAYTIDMHSITPDFDLNAVARIELHHTKTISGTNKRAQVFLEAQGIAAHQPKITGAAITSPAPTTIGNSPSFFTKGKYITARDKANGFQYIYDVRSSRLDEAASVIENRSGTMKINSDFEIWLQALTADTGDKPAASYPVNALLKFTDKNGKVIARNLSLTGTLQAYKIDLDSIDAAFDLNNVQRIELIHNQTLAGNNKRIMLIGEIRGFAKDAAVITGQAATGEPSTIGNLPVVYTAGKYIASKPKDGMGGAYQFDVKNNASDQAIYGFKNPDGTMAIDNNFKIWLKALQADTEPLPINEPVESLIKLVDNSGNVASAILHLTGTKQSFNLNISALNAAFNINAVKSIEIIHDQSISADSRRVKIEADIKGLLKDTTIITGQPITAADPSAFTNSPVVSIAGQYITQKEFDGGLSYNYNVSHGVNHSTTATIKRDTGTFGISGSTLTMFIEAANATAQGSITPPVHVLMRLADQAGNIIGVTLAVNGRQQFDLNLALLNPAFDPTKITRIEFMHSNKMAGLNLSARINIEVDGIGQKTSKRLSKDIKRQETTLTFFDTLTSKPIRQLTYQGLYNTEAELPPSKLIRETLFSGNEDLTRDYANTVIYHSSKRITLEPGQPNERILSLDPVNQNGSIIIGQLNGNTQYSLQKVFNRGTAQEFVLISEPVTSGGAFTGDTIHTRQKSSGDTTLTSRNVTQTGDNIDGVTEFSKQLSEYNVTYGGVPGNWNSVSSGLNSSFNAIADSAFSRQLNKSFFDAAESQVIQETSIISGYANDTFTTGTLEYSVQRVKKADHDNNAATPKVQAVFLQQNLNSTFGAVAGQTSYTIQASLEKYQDVDGDSVLDDVMAVASGLDSSFAATGASSYSIQASLEEHLDVDGNGVSDDLTFVISDLASNFQTTATTLYSRQALTRNVSRGGITADWMLVSSNLNSAFAATANSSFSAQHTNETAGTTYVIGNYKDGTFNGAPTGESLTYTMQKVENDTTRGGKAGDWVLVSSALNNTFGATTNTTFSAQLTDEAAGMTHVIGNFKDGTFAGAPTGESLTYTMQKQEKDTTRGGKAGDWVLVSSALNNTFGATADSTFSAQLTDEIAGTTHVIGNYKDNTFTTAPTGQALTYTMQKQEKNTTRGGKAGDWVLVSSLLGNTFGATADSTFSAQLTDEIAGTTHVIGNYKDNTFTTAPTGQALTYTMQKQEQGSTRGGKTGDWVLVSSALNDTFGATTNTTFSAQLTDEAAGMTHVIGNFKDGTFAGAPTGESLTYTMQKQEKDTTRGGKAGDWVLVSSNLSNTFGTAADATYSAQLIDEASATTFIIGNFLDATFTGAGTGEELEYSKQKQEQDTTRGGKAGDWVLSSSILNSTFGRGEFSNYSAQLSDEATGFTFIIGNYADDTFTSAPEGAALTYTKQKSEPGTTQGGKAGDWVATASNLSAAFAATTDSTFSRQLAEGLTSYIIGGYLTDTFSTGDLDYSSQKDIGAGGTKTLTSLSNTFGIVSGGANPTQTVHGKDFDQNGLDDQKVYGGVCTDQELVAGNCSPRLELIQTVWNIFDAPLRLQASSTLKPNDITTLPSGNGPFEALIAPLNNTSSVNFNFASNRGMTFNYNTTVGGWAAAGFTYNTPKDFSGFSQLAFGIYRTAGDVAGLIFRIEDADGKKANIRLDGVTTSEQVYGISMIDVMNNNPDIDLSRIKLMFFEVQGTNKSGTFEINRIPNPATGGTLNQSDVLDTGDISGIPNGIAGYPVSARVAPDGNTSTVSDTARGIKFNYNTSVGGFAGAGFNYDNFGTGSIETGDLSDLSQLTFGLKGNIGTVKFEIEDKNGNKGTINLTGISSTQERVFAISKLSLATTGPLDLTQIKVMFFIVSDAAAPGILEINRHPAAVARHTAQLIVDHDQEQTIKVTTKLDGSTLRQDVYEGMHDSLSDLVDALLIQVVYFLDGNQSLTHDIASGSTIHSLYNEEGVLQRQDTYDGLYDRVEDEGLPANKLIQRTFFISSTRRLIQQDAFEPAGLDQTVDAYFDAAGNALRQFTYLQVVSNPDLLDDLYKYEGVIFLGDLEQLVQKYFSLSDPDFEPQTDHRIFDAETSRLKEQHTYDGIIESTLGGDLLQSMFVLSDSQSLIKDYVNFETRRIFFDGEGAAEKVYYYEGLPSPAAPLNTDGLFKYRADVVIDDATTIIISYDDPDTTRVETQTEIQFVETIEVEPGVFSQRLKRRDTYNGITEENPTVLQATDPDAISIPVYGNAGSPTTATKMVVKDLEQGKTFIVTFGNPECTDTYDGVKYVRGNNSVIFDVTTTGLTHESTDCG